MKKALFVIAVLVAVLVFYLRSHRYVEPQVLSDIASTEKASPMGTPSSDTKLPEIRREQEVHESKVAAELSPKEVVHSFATNQMNIYGIDKNKEIIQKLAQQEEAIAKSRQALLDVDWAKQTFGEEQAAARVMAIKVLAERAHSGNERDLTEVVGKLGSDYEHLDVSRRADLRDLVTELIDVVGAERFFSDPSSVMQTFSNPSEVRHTVIAASIAFLGDRINDPDFAQRMRRWH